MNKEQLSAISYAYIYLFVESICEKIFLQMYLYIWLILKVVFLTIVKLFVIYYDMKH